MNRVPVIFLGVFLGFAGSFLGLVVGPQAQIGRQPQVRLESTGALYPQDRPGPARRGAELYRALGCVECHTRQVRPRGQGSDFARGWGQRRSVARDYLFDRPVLLGNQRLGPDLANVGGRLPEVDYQLKHLYNPRLVVPGSMMPPYSFLFSRRKLGPGRPPSADALKLDGVPEHEVLPKEEAELLVAWLLSLRADTPLVEAPLPLPPPTHAPAPNPAGAPLGP